MPTSLLEINWIRYDMQTCSGNKNELQFYFIPIQQFNERTNSINILNKAALKQKAGVFGCESGRKKIESSP